jgi:hypothetical protein
VRHAGDFNGSHPARAECLAFTRQWPKLNFVALQHKVTIMHLTFDRLQASARPAILEHLSGLSPDDLFTRFGLTLGPASLASYVDSINFNRDIVIGAHYRGLLIGVVHIAVLQTDAFPHGELGISVDSFCRARALAASCSIRRCVMHCAAR